MPTPFQCQLGVLVTSTIAAILAEDPDRRDFDPPDVLRRVTAACVGRPVNGNRQRARQTVFTRVMHYLRDELPPTGLHLIGSEVALGRGRVDLLFADGPLHSATRVLVDEVKSSPQVDPTEPATRDQIRSYLVAGQERWREAFAGVRLVSVVDPRQSRWFADAAELDQIGAVQ